MAKYQYIGSGDNPPASIKFMGKVRFRLNQGYVEVIDPEVLQKLENHRCFKLKAEQKPVVKKAVKKTVKKAVKPNKE